MHRLSETDAESEKRKVDQLGCVVTQTIVVLTLDRSMTQIIEAIYTDGVLKPTAELPLRDNQRVRLTVDETNTDREAAITRLKAGIASMRFFSEGPLPDREELHDRH
jgi:predicted DNA-binding antitoxin AbrB/MazE fold protein